jgi:hypothetical protein
MRAQMDYYAHGPETVRVHTRQLFSGDVRRALLALAEAVDQAAQGRLASVLRGRRCHSADWGTFGKSRR